MLNIDKILPSFFIISLFFIFYFLNYQQVFSGNYESDTVEHIAILKQYFKGERYLPHPLWHYGTYALSIALQIDVENAAVIFSAILLVLWTVIVFSFVRNQLKVETINKVYKNTYLIFVVLIIIFIGPLPNPNNYMIYPGTGSPNIWHNVTIWMVKPFAFLTIVSVLIAIKSNRNRYYVITYILGIVSLFAKPSFIIMFLPTLLIVALINKYSSKNFWLFFSALGTTSFIILLYQFFNTFSESEVVFNYLGVWSLNSSNIAMSILLGLAFPLIFIIWNQKLLEDPLFQIIWIQVVIGIVFYALLAQTGKQYTHANFSWSYMIAMSMLYTFSIVKFIKIYQQIPFFKRGMLTLLLFVQVIIGMYYFIKIIQGQHPIFISIFFLR